MRLKSCSPESSLSNSPHGNREYERQFGDKESKQRKNHKYPSGILYRAAGRDRYEGYHSQEAGDGG